MYVRYAISIILSILVLCSSTNAQEFTPRDGLESWSEEHNGVTMIYFGEKGGWGNKKLMGSCPMRTLQTTTATIELSTAIKAAGLEGEAAIKFSEAVATLATQNADVSKLVDLLAVNCLLYWTGGQDRPARIRNDAVIMRAIASLSGQTADRDTIFLVDSPAQTYLSGITQDGRTNADDIYKSLLVSRIDARILTANANPYWIRTQDVIDALPKLVIVHFSAFEGEDLLQCDASKGLGNFCLATLLNFVKDVLSKGSKVVIYSRTTGFCDAEIRANLTTLLRDGLGVSPGLLPGVTLLRLNKTNRLDVAAADANWSRLAAVAHEVLEGAAPQAPDVCHLG